MGYRSLYKMDPLRAAFNAVRDPAEKERKRLIQERVDLFYENGTNVLRYWVNLIFKDPNVKARLDPFLTLAMAPSTFKRTIDEVAGPTYQVPPTRKILVGESREPDKDKTRRYREIANEMRLDCTLDLGCHLGHACNTVFLQLRKDPRLGFLSDVLTPAQVTVGPDPDDVHRELFIVYEREYMVDGRPETIYAYWDDEEVFLFNRNGAYVPLPSGLFRERNTLGALPFVPVHMTERPCGMYWDMNTGNALKFGAIAGSLIVALTLKLHKSAGFKQLVVTGDIVNFPKEQAPDEENAILVPEGSRLETLDLTTPASHYLATLDDLTKRVASNYGINLDRLNAQASADAGEAGLWERREDSIKVFRRVEEKCFSLVSRMSGEFGTDSRLKVDFGELSLRIDPKGTQELWETLISKGLRNELDNIRAMNPEIDSDEEAWEEYDRNLKIHSEAIQRMRALNMSEDASAEMPGQSATENGKLGPMTRDGEITGDEASEIAKGQNKDLSEIVKKALGGAY